MQDLYIEVLNLGHAPHKLRKLRGKSHSLLNYEIPSLSIEKDILRLIVTTILFIDRGKWFFPPFPPYQSNKPMDDM